MSSGLWFTTSLLIDSRNVSSSRRRPILTRAPGLGADFERIVPRMDILDGFSYVESGLHEEVTIKGEEEGRGKRLVPHS